MSKYIKKPARVAAEVAPQLPILDRITDMVIDMDDSHMIPSNPQLRRFAELSAEAFRQAEQGLVVLASPWMPPRITQRTPWYGRDEATHPLPAILTKTFRVGGMRVQ